MRNRPKDAPARWSRRGRRVVIALVWLGLAGSAYWWGRTGAVPQAKADPPPFPQTDSTPLPSAPATTPTDYSRRVVAYIHNTMPITREDLGEYLIARYGKQKLPLLINKKIIDHYCQQKGVTVNAAEVDAALVADMTSFGVSKKDFENNILKRYNKSLYEWKEDVIRPRLLMSKLCGPRVSVTAEDLAKRFEALYGEKVDCKVVMFKHGEEREVLHKIWPKLRESEEEFERVARSQFDYSLAAVGGHIKPVGKNTLDDPELEKMIFRLRPGEVSEVKNTGLGLVVVKCLGRTPPNTQVTLEQVRGDLEKEIQDKKIQAEIPKLFQELQAQAKPRDLMNGDSAEQLKQASAELYQQTGPSTDPALGATAPAATVAPPKK